MVNSHFFLGAAFLAATGAAGAFALPQSFAAPQSLAEPLAAPQSFAEPQSLAEPVGFASFVFLLKMPMCVSLQEFGR